jgi:N6-adenosine-specific RNA methylase IME4
VHPFASLPHEHFGAILADAPWNFDRYSDVAAGRSPQDKYDTMSIDEIAAMPVCDLVLPNSVLFFWATWPRLPDALRIIEAWGFTYKSGAFDWMKADNTQADFFQAEIKADMKMGYWTRANTEPCLLATRGRPKRLNADVRQGIIEPARQHSRKPDTVYSRIERLVAGPYLELFARTQRPGWTAWGNEVGKFEAAA